MKSGAIPAGGEQKGWQIFLSLQGISPAVAGKSWVPEGESAQPFFLSWVRMAAPAFHTATASLCVLRLNKQGTCKSSAKQQGLLAHLQFR